MYVIFTGDWRWNQWSSSWSEASGANPNFPTVNKSVEEPLTSCSNSTGSCYRTLLSKTSMLRYSHPEERRARDRTVCVCSCSGFFGEIPSTNMRSRTELEPFSDPGFEFKLLLRKREFWIVSIPKCCQYCVQRSAICKELDCAVHRGWQ